MDGEKGGDRHTSGVSAFIHSSIFFLIFSEKFRYENSPEYSVQELETSFTAKQPKCLQLRSHLNHEQSTYALYYPAKP